MCFTNKEEKNQICLSDGITDCKKINDEERRMVMIIAVEGIVKIIT